MAKKDTKLEKEVKDNIIEIDDDSEIVVSNKESFNLLEVILIMFITLFFGGLLGSAITYATSKSHSNDLVKESGLPNELKEFVQTYSDISNNYYEDIDSKELIDAGIEGMLDYLGDKYSVYMNSSVSKVFNEQIEGRYNGIGVELTVRFLDLENPSYEKANYFISKINEDGPSFNSGLQVGDQLVKVDDNEVKGLSTSKVSYYIKENNNPSVKLTVLRDDKVLEFTINKEKIDIESVSSKIIEKNDKKIGYIKIDIFADNSGRQFEKNLLKLENEGISSLIIDVRGNSGGYLTTAKEIVSMFLDTSKVIYQLDTKGEIEKIYSETSTSRSYPIAVLINKVSASASELLAASLLESYGAEVIGVNSFGKGTVQKAYNLQSGATVKYTIQKWLTPNGNWINDVGVTPTIKVELTKDATSDLQLDKAVEVLSEK